MRSRCGPGSLTLLLADRFEEAVGLDADPDMIDEANRLASKAGKHNTRWLHLRAENLPAGLGTFRLIIFAQSFHWMDRPRVAAAVRGMLETGGACAHVNATTHHGVDGTGSLPHPRPPYSAIAELIRLYLGPMRRAGRSFLPHGTVAGEAEIYRAAGFTGPQRIEIPRPSRRPHDRGHSRRDILTLQLGAAPVRRPPSRVRERPQAPPGRRRTRRNVQRAHPRNHRRRLVSVMSGTRRGWN